MTEHDHLKVVPKDMRFLDAPPSPEIKGKPGPVRPFKIIRSVRTEVPNLGSQLLALNTSLFGQFVEAMDVTAAEGDDPFAFLAQENKDSENIK
jgi:hypothetical protein